MASANFTGANLIAGASIFISILNVQNFHAAGAYSVRYVYPTLIRLIAGNFIGQLCLNYSPRARYLDEPREGIQTDLLRSTLQLEKLVRELNAQLRGVSNAWAGQHDLFDQFDRILTRSIPFIYMELGSRGAEPAYEVRRLERRLISEIGRLSAILETISKNIIVRNEPIREAATPTLFLRTVLNPVWHYLWSLIFADSNLAAFNRLTECKINIDAHLFNIRWLGSGSRDPLRRVILHQIEIHDFFGMSWSLPQDLCCQKEVFLRVLTIKFEGGPAQRVVSNGLFNVFRQLDDRLELVKNDEWTQAIESLQNLHLSVLVGRQSQQAATVGGLRCPRCNSSRSILHPDRQWADCTQCDSRFNIAPSQTPTSDSEEDVEELFSPSTRLHSPAAEELSKEFIFKIFSVRAGPEVDDTLQNPSLLSKLTIEEHTAEPYEANLSDGTAPALDEARLSPGQDEPFIPSPLPYPVDITVASESTPASADHKAETQEDIDLPPSSGGIELASITRNLKTLGQETEHSIAIAVTDETSGSSLSAPDPPPDPHSMIGGGKIEPQPFVLFDTSLGLAMAPDSPPTPKSSTPDKTSDPPSNPQFMIDSARKSLSLVFQLRKVGKPPTLSSKSRRLKNVVTRCHGQPLNFMTVISKSLTVARIMLEVTEDGYQFCDTLLEIAQSTGTSDEHLTGEGARFVGEKTSQIQELAGRLVISAKHMHDEFRRFRVGIFNIQKDLADLAKDVKKESFLLAATKRVFSREDPETFTRAVEQIQDLITNILENLGHIVSWWHSSVVKAQYLKKNAHSFLVQELSEVHLRNVKKNFVGLQSLLQGYNDKMTELYGQFLGSLDATERPLLSSAEHDVLEELEKLQKSQS